MSENIAPPAPKVRVHRNRAKRRFSRARLPTPPPDPMASEEVLDQPGSSVENSPIKEAQFFEYINSLQKSPHPLHLTRTDSLFAPVVGTEDAFDHLDKLYKLMEQMLNLRQQNAKLQRRVRDLEHLKNLQSMHRQLDNVSVFEDIPEMDDDSCFAESLLDAMLTGTKKDVKPKPWTRSRLRQSLMRRQRNRSSSLNERLSTADLEDVQNQRRASAGSDREKSAKVSKWTKVKAAFRWEKAAPSVSDAKSQDSGISGMLPVNYEVARYLRVPSTSDETGLSPADSGAADGSTPGTLSSASSADDIHRQEHRGIHGESQVSDDDRHSITLDDAHLIRGAHNSSSNKKPWVKMRHIVPSRSSVHSKHRLSARSDDVKTEISDEDLEIEHGESSRSQLKMGMKLVKQTSKSREKLEIPADVIARYRQAVADDESTSKHNYAPKLVSKWTRVKKAFLTPTTTNLHHGKHKSDIATSSTTLNTNKEIGAHKYNDESKKIQDEIQTNYRQLQKKLSLEFQDKLREWEKLKSSSPSAVAGAHARCDGVIDDQKDHAFMKKMEEWQRIKSQPTKPGQNIQMIREENLAPEFKKKLEEWQKIKKFAVRDDSLPASKAKKKLGEWPKWKSVSGHREEPPHAENQPLSEEFIKKLEEWRKIKEGHKHDDVKEKTPSPRPARKHSVQPSTSGQSKKIKEQDPKELQWFENELDKIEKEKQRLENERQKFLQHEERLTKLRRTVMGNGNKKDVLIHTSSGFYRFEGISRKFTQKLCEWEKAQGIGPEASTFALLTSNFTPRITVNCYETDSQEVPATQYSGPKLIRSKSAESLGIPNFMQPCSSTSHHPSSLSLNDVDELERQCLALSRDSSTQNIDGSLENMGNDEPEAVIVEFEDIVEETASPLEERLQEQHFPIYQREMPLNTCEEKSLVVPCIQRVDSKSAQYSYFLIEEIMKLIKSIQESESKPLETEYQFLRSNSGIDLQDSHGEFENKESPSPDNLQLKHKNKMQKQRSDTVLEKIIRLQEIHSKNISDVAVEGFVHTSTHFANLLEAAQDSFSELLQMIEQLQSILENRCGENYCEVSFTFTDSSYSDVTAVTSELVAKLSELKRILSYFYAASDMTAPGRKIKCGKKSKKERKDKNETDGQKTEGYLHLNSPTNESPIQNEQEQSGVKRMRYKKKDYSSKTFYESEDSDLNDQRLNLQGKNEETICKQKYDIDPIIIEKLVIPTKPNYVNASSAPSPTTERKPVEVFVKTTRKLFTPVLETDTTQSPSCSSVDLTEQDEETFTQMRSTHDISEYATARLPPLPVSPTPQRKSSKEISPSIRIMLAKYNQMISGHEASGSVRSAGSSGSASPVAWRSPVSERRVKIQRDRYLQEIRKIGNIEVKKSSSVSVLNSENKTLITPQSCSVTLLTPEDNQKIGRSILRSTSASLMNINTNKSELPERSNPLKLVIAESAETGRHSPEIRYNKIQKAKEEFLNSPMSVAGPSSAPPLLPGDRDNITKYPTRSRFSQISVGSESSCDSSPYGLLVKSASAGMINVDEDTYRKIDPEFHGDGYVSLPRTVQKQKEGFLGGKLALSNIAAKFRKVRMRRSKEQKKMNTVSALCRQSLVVDIHPGSQETLPLDTQNRRESLTVPSENRASSSEDTSPSSSRSGSWIRRSRIFKVL